MIISQYENLNESCDLSFFTKNNEFLNAESENAFTTSYQDDNNINPPNPFSHHSSNERYYDEMDLNESFFAGESIPSLSWNLRSLPATINELLLLKDNIENKTKKHLKLLFLQETWLPSDAAIPSFNLPHYKHFSVSRRKKKGGGVSIFAHESLYPEVIPEGCIMSEQIFEAVAIKIKGINSEIIVASLYHARKSNTSESNNDFIDILCKWLKKLSKFKIPVIFSCDLNYDFLELKSKSTHNLWSTLLTLSYVQHFFMSTRISNFQGRAKGSLIDNVFSNAKLVSDCFQLITSESDHNVLCFSISFPAYRQKIKESYSRKFSKKKIEQFSDFLEDSSWSFLDQYTNVDEKASKFMEFYLGEFESTFPLQTLKKNKRFVQSKPHFNDELSQLRNKRNSLYRKSIKSKSPEDILAFKQFKNNYNSVLRKTERQYNHSMIEKLSKEPRRLWNFISDSTGLGKNIEKKGSAIEQIIVDQTSFFDKNEICNKFNEYFVNIGTKVANNIPVTNRSINSNLRKSPSGGASFWCDPICPVELAQAIESLPEKHSVDLHGQSNSFVKKIPTLIAFPLSNIYNASIDQGHFPSIYKQIKVVPVLKKGCNPLFVSSYRPIAIISIFGKILEKLMNDRLMKYLEINNILDPAQFGYQSNLSIHHAIITFLNDLTLNINKNNVCTSIFFDARKAFDVIDRKLLLNK